MGTVKWSMSCAIAGGLTLVLGLSGCGPIPIVGHIGLVTPSTIEVPVPQARPAPSKAFVRLVEVKDMRQFDALARSSSVPSLQNAEQIADRSITSRAIGRKWDGTQQVADILLPEGQTVEQLVREVVAISLGEQGYAVVDAKSPESAKAFPLHVEIHQFWGWVSGLFMLSVEFEGILVLKGAPLSGQEGQRVRGYGKDPGPHWDVGKAQFRDVAQSAIADLIRNMKVAVKRPD